MKTENTELVVLQKLDVVPFFTKGDQLDDILQAIAKEARAHAPDLSTVKSRGEITKNITDVVTSSKTYLENSGKDLSAEYKAMPKIIDENRKRCRDFLTDLQAELRQPLTDWETEQKRIKEEQRLAKEAEELRIKIESDHEMALLMNEKFDREAEEARLEAARLEEARLKKEEEERLAREEQIRVDAEKKAKEEAEREKHQLIIDSAHSEALLINREIDEVAAEARRQDEAKQREEQKKKDDEAAEQHRLDGIEQAKLEEQQKQKAEADRIKREQEQREANNLHVGTIRRQSKEDLMSLGIDEETAKKVVLAIHKKQIRNVAINY